MEFKDLPGFKRLEKRNKGINKPSYKDPHYAVTDLPSFTFGEFGVCFYCGEYAEGFDHVIPASMIDVKTQMARFGPKCFCCPDCNYRLGDSYFGSIRGRLIFLRKQIRKAFHKILWYPDWEKRELDELDHVLKTFVTAKQELRIQVERRIDWQDTTRFGKLWKTSQEAAQILYPENVWLQNFLS